LRETALPDLFDDPRAFALAHANRWHPRENGRAPGAVRAAAAVLRDPLSTEARMAAGLAFEVEGLKRCALEQFMTAADLSDRPAPALLSAARILMQEGSAAEASQVAERVLAFDPGSREAASLVSSGESLPMKGE
jgi:hypothetical protein